MEWIRSIQRAIDYIEEHITEETDMEGIARQAYSSPFHFQRVFSILCGYTVGDYVRMRRLSMAAEEIMQGTRVIDAALKYGYDAPESFTRAFTRFHGVTPTEVKHGANVKSFSRLSLKLILTGGTTMDYRIEKPGSFKILCKRKQVHKPQDALATGDISEFWDECRKDGSISTICSCFPEDHKLKGLLGVCFSADMEANKFPYGIGVEYDGRPVPEGLEVVEIPSCTFAVFGCKGKMPDVFAETYKRICTEFFPQSSKYEYAEGIELEVYPSENIDDPDYYCEIWIAVKEK